LRGFHPDSPELRPFIDELTRSQSAVGAIVAGSYAYGVPRLDSDLDLGLVLEAGRTRRGHGYIGSCRVDMWVRNAGDIQRQFTRRGPAITLELFSLGTVVVDPQGRLAELQNRARSLWNNGLPIIARVIEGRAMRLRRLATAFDNVAPPRRILLRAAILSELVSYWYASRGRYRRAPMAAMEELERLRPDIAAMLDLVEAERGASMFAIVDGMLRQMNELHALEFAPLESPILRTRATARTNID
jgi:hypothetical protein